MNYPYYGYQQNMYYQPPAPDQLAQLRQAQYQPMQQSQPVQTQPGIVWVANREEADRHLVAPNSAVALWDMNSPVVYFKQADASGRPSMTIYDLVERADRPAVQTKPGVEYVTRQEFDALAARLDALAAAPVTAKEEADHE